MANKTWSKPQPTPGHPVERQKPYVWATWLAKFMGGQECQYAAWFMAHFKHAKYEQDAEKLQEWNKEHTALMAERRAQLERDGMTVTVEGANDFILRGEACDVAGKPDIVAAVDDQRLIVDGKTGRRRYADSHQVSIYLYALPIAKPEIFSGKDVAGEVTYGVDTRSGRPRKPVQVDPPSIDWIDNMVASIKAIAGPKPLARVPSEYGCQKCNIGPQDCPERFKGKATATTSRW